MTDDTTPESNLSEHLQTAAQNTSLHKECTRIVFSEMKYLPWDNPDNIVSAEVEVIANQILINLNVMLFLIGVPANVLNIAVFCTQGLKDRVNLLLFALSLTDALYLISMIFLYSEQLLTQFTTKERFGPFITSFANANLLFLSVPAIISPALSAIIATERCLCVLSPLRFQTLLRTRTMAAIIIVVSVVISSLFFIVAFRYRIGCVYDPVSGRVVRSPVAGTFYTTHKGLIDAIHSYVFGVSLPGIEMVVVTVTTIITIVKLRQVVTWRSETASVISAKEVALTKALVANSIFFMACTSPVALNRFSWLFLPEVRAGRRHHNFFMTGTWINGMLNTVNASFNFFVYYAMGSRYRETFWTLFSRKPKAPKT